MSDHRIVPAESENAWYSSKGQFESEGVNKLFTEEPSEVIPSLFRIRASLLFKLNVVEVAAQRKITKSCWESERVSVEPQV